MPCAVVLNCITDLHLVHPPTQSLPLSKNSIEKKCWEEISYHFAELKSAHMSIYLTQYKQQQKN